MKHKNEYDAELAGRKLKDLRGIRTRIGVANETGINVISLQAYEEARRTPPPDRMATIANYYGVSVQWLFFTKDDYLEQ